MRAFSYARARAKPKRSARHLALEKGSSVKRSRRGGRRPQNGQSNHSGIGNNNGGGGYNPNRVYDSNGPEVKIRGTASHVYEKYLQLARDANASGDRVMAENYLQHAEHYFRIMAAAQAQMPQFQPAQPQAPGIGAQPRLDMPAEGAPGAAGVSADVSGDVSGEAEAQPFAEVQTSAPSFSLTPPGEDVEEDAPENEEAEA